MSLEWHGDEVRRKLHAELVRRLKACAILVANRARKLVSVSGSWSIARIEAHYAGLSDAGKAQFRKEFNRHNTVVKHGGKRHRARITRGGTVRFSRELKD